MTRKEIENHTVAFLRTAGGTRPDVRVVEIENRRFVVKDFRRSDLLFKAIVGPLLIRRESAALARMDGVEGVPRLFQRIDRYAMVIEHIDGTALRDFKGDIPEGFFDELVDIMDAVHSLGVTHCDLRSSGNVMVTSDGKPKVVDFAACVMRGHGLNPLINFLFRQFIDGDHYAVLMLKRKHAPDQLRPEEIDRLNTPLPYEELAKNIGRSTRNITRRMLTRKK
ncbi:MAG: hypothetical protein ABFD46_09805 [Armatimonadota bacterium]